MTTQYTTILKLALPVQGELSGTWGDVVNDNITQMVEQAVAGKAVINTWTGNSHTLTTADGTTSESRCAILELTDSGTALTGAGTVVCPTNTKLYIVDNNTAEIVTVKTSGGTGVAVPVGKTMLVYCDGTNVVEGVTHANSLSLGTSTVTADKILDEDNMASDSATAIATQQSIKAYVDSQVGTVDTLAEILANGNTTGANDIDVDSAQKVQFRDAAIYLNSSVDGQLDIVADGEVQIDTALVDINGNLDVSGTTNISGSVSFTKNAIAGVAISTTSRSSNTVTVTTSAVHGLTSGDLVNVNGVADTSFNGYFTASVSSTTVFTYNQTGADGSSTGGTSTEVVYNLNASGTALNWMNGPLNIAANSGIDGLEITQSGAGNGLHVTGTTGLVGNVNVTGSVTADGLTVDGTTATIQDDSANLRFENSAGTRTGYIQNRADAFEIWDDQATPMTFGTSNTERLRIDASGTLFQGTTSPTLHSSVTGTVFTNGSLLTESARGSDKSLTLAQNVVIDSGNTWAYLSTDEASYYQQYGGNHYFATAASGTAGADATLATKMTILNNGNVGIGTSSPASSLDIRSPNTAVQSRGNLYVTTTSTAAVNEGAQISLGGTYTGTSETFFGAIAARKENATVGDFNAYLQFSVRNTGNLSEKMRIDASGNVGIGVTPSAWGDTSTALQIGSLALEDYTVSGANASVFYNNAFRNSSGNVVYIESDFASTYSQYNGEHTFNTAPSGTADATATLTTVMKIDTSGNVGIGTSSVTNPLSYGRVLNVAGYAPAIVLSEDTGRDYTIGVNGNKFSIFDETDAVLTIDDSGNVGIGTSNATPSNGEGLCLGAASTITRLDMRNSTTGDATGDGTSLQLNGNNFTIENREAGYVAIATSLTERMRIDSSGKVGIGCTPGYTFEVRTNDTSATPQQVIRQIGTGDAAIGFQIPSAANWYAGVDNSASDSFVIGRGLAVGTDVAMTLDASGNLLVGKSASSFTTAGAEVQPSGRIELSRDGELINLNRLSSNGNLMTFYGSSALVGSIGVDSGDNLYIGGSAASHSGLYFGTNTAAPITAGTLTDAVTDLGTAGYRFKDLYLSGGVYLGGTGAANKLDDYEEGTWTPTVTSSGGTITSVISEIGTYTKIGRLVTLQYQFNIATLGTASGNCIVSGMPFTEDNTEITYYAGVHRARSGASSITEFDPAGTLQLYGTTPVAGVYLGSMVYNTTS